MKISIVTAPHHVKSEFNRIYFIVKNRYCKTKKYYKIKYIDARLYIDKDGHQKRYFIVF